jgi:hypothetical protein
MLPDWSRTQTISLPVVIACDSSPNVGLESIRIYHSMWPILGLQLVRAPVLPVVAALILPDVIGRYHDCLARGDLSGILEQFAPGGGPREPGGALQIHRGATELRRFFTVLFSNGGGLGIENCAVVDEGASCALEYVVTTWGRTTFLNQAGAAVYDRPDTGLLAEVRMYDDVEHPLAGDLPTALNGHMID